MSSDALLQAVYPVHIVRNRHRRNVKPVRDATGYEQPAIIGHLR
jgi:hypothetical protein